MEKEFINLEVNKDKIIKLEIEDDQNEEPLQCGGEEEMEKEIISKEVKLKKSQPSKLICYKCKKEKSNFLNRSEYICK
jgi:hypothetical protein